MSYKKKLPTEKKFTLKILTRFKFYSIVLAQSQNNDIVAPEGECKIPIISNLELKARLNCEGRSLRAGPRFCSSGSPRQTCVLGLSVEEAQLQCTVKNTQVTASLLRACYLAVIKPISGCVHIACSGLMITSLLQADSREILFTRLVQVVSTTCSKSANTKLYQVITDLIKLNEANRIVTT